MSDQFYCRDCEVIYANDGPCKFCLSPLVPYSAPTGCAFCGWQTPEPGDLDALRAHIPTCGKHPMAKLNARHTEALTFAMLVLTVMERECDLDEDGFCRTHKQMVYRADGSKACIYKVGRVLFREGCES